MLGNGTSKDNNHFGDTYIRNGSLFVDEDAFIGGDLTVDGSIIGFNINNETIRINRWYSTNQTGISIPTATPQTILKNVTNQFSNTGEKTIGNNVIQGTDLKDATSFAIMNLKIANRVENNVASVDNINQFSIFLTTGGVTSDISLEEQNFGGILLSAFGGAYQNMDLNLTLTRSAANPTRIICVVNCYKPSNEASTTVPVGTNGEKFFSTSNYLKIGSQNGNIICPVSNSLTNSSAFILFGYTEGDDITVDIRCLKAPNAPNVIEANLMYGTLDIYKQEQIPTGGGGGGGGTTDHLALSNLNAIGSSGFNDAGHDLMFLSNASKPINGNYFLPTTDGGIAGAVLTTDGAGSTSFQTLTSGVSRAWVNKYAILTNPTFGAGIGIPTNLDSSGSGSKNYTDVNFPIGSQLHIQACGSWNINTTNSCLGQFVLQAGATGFSITDVFELVAPITVLNEVNTGVGSWSVDVNLVRIGVNTVRLGRVTVNTRFSGTGTINVPVVNSITNQPNGFTFGVSAFPFDIDLQWIDQSAGGQCFPVAGTYNHNVINANDTLAVTSNPSLDHNTLSNLTTGDPHNQYTKNGGRAGGQILSGGLTPLHNLVLKSHDIGLPNVTVKDLNTQFNKNIDMDNHEIKNVSVIDNLSSSIDVISDGTLLLKSISNTLDIDSNLIQFISTAVPQGTIDAVGGWTLTNTLNMSNNNIINVNTSNAQQTQTELIVKPSVGQLPITATNGVLLTENNLPGGEIWESNVTENKSYKTLNMNNNNIDNVPQVSNSAGVLSLLGNGRTDIGITAGGGRLEVEDTRVYISPFADFNIGSVVIYVQANTMPNFFVGDTTYIFMGSRNTSNSYVLPDNVKIRGLGKNNSFINYNGGGSLFSSVDNNLSVADITLTSSNTTGKLFDLSNVAKDKTVDMTGVQIRNTYNGMLIDGYDLVDMLNCVFTYFQSGSPTPVGIEFSNNSKVQFTSCEFLRWFQQGGTPATSAFVGNMLEFNTSVNAYNITSCLFHPQYDQNGIDLSNVTSTIEGTISANTFIDINLNTGGGFVVLNIPTVVATNAVVEGNSINPNLRAQLTYVFSGVNSSNTILSGGSNPNAVNTGGLVIALTSQFSSITAGGLATYLKKRSANFLITASANLQVIAGGSGQRVGLGLRVNGVDIPNGYSFVTLDSAGTEPKQTTLNFTGVASQNDTFELTIFNASGNNDVLVSDVNFAGIEI